MVKFEKIGYKKYIISELDTDNQKKISIFISKLENKFKGYKFFGIGL